MPNPRTPTQSAARAAAAPDDERERADRAKAAAAAPPDPDYRPGQEPPQEPAPDPTDETCSEPCQEPLPICEPEEEPDEDEITDLMDIVEAKPLELVFEPPPDLPPEPKPTCPTAGYPRFPVAPYAHGYHEQQMTEAVLLMARSIKDHVDRGAYPPVSKSVLIFLIEGVDEKEGKFVITREDDLKWGEQLLSAHIEIDGQPIEIHELTDLALPGLDSDEAAKVIHDAIPEPALMTEDELEELVEIAHTLSEPDDEARAVRTFPAAKRGPVRASQRGSKRPRAKK
jgi:hypothetical protein